MKKGQGAYFSGSRPGQTPTSWGYARLASSITGNKAAAVDFHILEKYCNHKTSKAYKLGLKAKKKHGKYGEKSCVSWQMINQKIDKEDLIVEGEYQEVTNETT